MKDNMSADRSMEPTPHCTPSPPLKPILNGVAKDENLIGSVQDDNLSRVQNSSSIKDRATVDPKALNPETNEFLTVDVPSDPSQSLYGDNNITQVGPPTFGDSVIDTRFLDSPVPETSGGPVAFPTGNYPFQIEHRRDIREIRDAHSHHSMSVVGPRISDTYLSPPYGEPYPGSIGNDWMDGRIPGAYSWSTQQQQVSMQHMQSGQRRDVSSYVREAQENQLATIPTVLEKFPGFVRCVVDIAPEVVGWVIGRSGSHIKEMKHRSGCGMWVDQKELKLYITGADMMRINAATEMVGDLILKAPVNVSAAGVENGVVSHMIDCPPHLIGLLIGRGGTTIKRIKEESRANVVINQKMMKVIVSGVPRSVRHAVNKIEEVFNFGKASDDDLVNSHLTPPTPSSMNMHHFALQPEMTLGPESYGLFPPGVVPRPISNENLNTVAAGLEDLTLDGSYSRNFHRADSEVPDIYTEMSTSKPPPPPGLSTQTSEGGNIVDLLGQHSSSSKRSSSLKDSPESQGSGPDWSIFSGALFSGSKKEQSSSTSQLLSTKPGSVCGSTNSDVLVSPERRSSIVANSLEDFLRSIPPGLVKYKSFFQENEIDVEAMHLMTVPDFVEIGIPKGPAIKISYLLREGCIPPGSSYTLSTRQFLESLGLSKYITKFEEEEIDLPAMAAMRDQDFAELGLVKGPRLKIIAELRRLFTSSTREVSRTFWSAGQQANAVNASSQLGQSSDTSLSSFGLLKNSTLSHSAQLHYSSSHISP